MKKVIILGAFSLLFSFGTFAQTQKTNTIQKEQATSVQSQNNNKKSAQKQTAKADSGLRLKKKTTALKVKRIDTKNLKEIKAVKSEPKVKANASH